MTSGGTMNNPHKRWQIEKKAEKMVEILQEKDYSVQLAEDLTQAKEMALAMVEENAIVSVGGSVTLEEMDMIETLRNGPYRFLDRYRKDVTHNPDIINIYREGVVADVMLTSVNAVTMNGEMVLSDASGNRISGLIFGAKKAIVIVGVNKLVKDLSAAFERIRDIEPMNARRNNHLTGSGLEGFYVEEFNKKRMLNYTGIIHYGGKFEGRLNIIVVKDEVGF